MINKLRASNEKGFTLIELMIVIAIIGILAAIAIPNFISYRNKAYCSSTESDGNSVAAALADWYSNPVHVSFPFAADEITAINDSTTRSVTNTFEALGLTMSNDNTCAFTGSDPDDMTIIITDASSRCPGDVPGTANDRPGWSGYTYTIVIENLNL